MCGSTKDIDKDESKLTDLSRQNGFEVIFLHMIQRLVKGTTKPNICYWLVK
jgi:hypothetical protein